MIDLWFVIIAFLWTGYFVLEGFDFGVGLLAPFVSADGEEQRQSLETIGPVWDGNEVWLITAVGAMFAAFPAWYAGMFSGFYLPVVLVLVGLIVRGVGLEWRGKVANPAWCDLGIVIGSALPAFVWGTIFADLLFGSAEAALLGGAFTLAVCLLHGAVFLALRTEGPVRRRARTAALAASVVVLPVAVVALSSMGSLPALAAMGVLAAATVLVFLRKEGWAFTAMTVAIVLVSVAVFSQLRGAPLPGLTLAEAASGPYTLTMLTWIGLIALPFVLGYQGWTYWVFRKRVQVAVRS
ncbi:cytochrome d ubiquinol oxidase subunit II [Nonomuraea glycinis]|jgi:cytochrome d ubiquinol oxidase subunit II|uniref:Cytochrome c oxidase assembly protein n=1 Tax=Nonomuraea glycinis TaxID=2047744 RepID=A0A918EA04_9ACTN|nr:cytochrome d ubiquinol oxidase subunit II [Nonomuraea glycinis]MCA2182434.1 cytochrome d ubiquinol oxidase subunit II [Nonomuraea glycinis]WSG67346.1 cytochrome d ubiquinol oxidase subunit II [Nonomuraea glycinis]GGP16178.1 cytochrome c oxidase assembly protein [Nonomuraea glycinis]